MSAAAPVSKRSLLSPERRARANRLKAKARQRLYAMQKEDDACHCEDLADNLAGEMEPRRRFLIVLEEACSRHFIAVVRDIAVMQ